MRTSHSERAGTHGDIYTVRRTGESGLVRGRIRECVTQDSTRFPNLRRSIRYAWPEAKAHIAHKVASFHYWGKFDVAHCWIFAIRIKRSVNSMETGKNKCARSRAPSIEGEIRSGIRVMSLFRELVLAGVRFFLSMRTDKRERKRERRKINVNWSSLSTMLILSVIKTVVYLGVNRLIFCLILWTCIQNYNLIPILFLIEWILIRRNII